MVRRRVESGSKNVHGSEEPIACKSRPRREERVRERM